MQRWDARGKCLLVSLWREVQNTQICTLNFRCRGFKAPMEKARLPGHAKKLWGGGEAPRLKSINEILVMLWGRRYRKNEEKVKNPSKTTTLLCLRHRTCVNRMRVWSGRVNVLHKSNKSGKFQGDIHWWSEGQRWDFIGMTALAVDACVCVKATGEHQVSSSLLFTLIFKTVSLTDRRVR